MTWMSKLGAFFLASPGRHALIMGLIAGLYAGWLFNDLKWEAKFSIAEKEWSYQRAAQDRANLSHAQQTVEWERREAELSAAADSAYQRGIEDGKKSLDADIAGIHDGSKRLRDKFRCPATAKQPHPVPSASTSPSINNEASGGGLQPADAEFLIRFGHEADEVVGQLTACQSRLNRGGGK